MSSSFAARWMTTLAIPLAICTTCSTALAQKKAAKNSAVAFPPTLPDGREVATETSAKFLEGPNSLASDVAIATTPPTVDFLFYPGQTYEGKPWSNWGDSLAINGKYYASIGDHRAIGASDSAEHGTGTARVFEYDPDRKSFRQLLDVAQVLNLPAGHYTPGKIHGRLDMGNDGWLYFSTHRGSTRVTTDENYYEGDWIIRCDPRSGKGEVVAHGPVPKHCIPNSVLDPDRLIFYGGTAPGVAGPEAGVQFFAYDVKKRSMLYACGDGPPRAMIFCRSNGKIYYIPGTENGIGTLVRFDPARPGAPEKTSASLGLRAATQETPQRVVYTVAQTGNGGAAELFSFNTRTEEVQRLGSSAVGSANYIASLDVDPTGRYLYYVSGAHGGSDRDGSPLVQFDTRTRRKKVIAFLHPFCKDRYGATLVGTYSSAVDPRGDRVYITWNASRSPGRAWDCCALTVVHVPAAERP